MEDILKQLCAGEITPDGQIDTSGKDFKSTAKAYDKVETEFFKNLSSEQQEAFEQLKRVKYANDREYELLYFKRGFQLGMQMTLAGLEIPHTKPNQ